MSKPISFCIDEWKQFNKIPSKENGTHFDLTRFLFVYFAKSCRGEISPATYIIVNQTWAIKPFSWRTHSIIANWSWKYLRKCSIMDVVLGKQYFGKVVQDLQKQKMACSAIAHIWKWTWKRGGCCQERKVLGKKVKKFFGGNFPYWFFSFLDKRSELRRQEVETFCF